MFLKYQKKDWHVVSTSLNRTNFHWSTRFMVTVDKVLFSPETVLVKLPCSETASRHLAEETKKMFTRGKQNE